LLVPVAARRKHGHNLAIKGRERHPAALAAADGLKHAARMAEDRPPAQAPRPELIRAADDEARLLARGLIRASLSATLATLGADGDPLATLTATGTDMDGTPVLLVSRLSAHTTNLLADPRCSLLCARTGKGDPLAHPRLSVVAQARIVERESAEGPRIRARFLSRQPKAALYADFPDFLFIRLEMTGASLNGGFGRAFSLTPGDLMTDVAGAEALADAEPEIIAHMNEDHPDAVALYATALAGKDDGPWRLASLDPDGMDLASGAEMARIAFGARVETPDAARAELVRLAKQARAV
jgi:hypothetical protein